MSNEQEPGFNVHFQGYEFEGNLQNSRLSMHHEDFSMYDCIQIKLSKPEQLMAGMAGLLCFRQVMPNFDEVADYMMDKGFSVSYTDEPSEFHVKHYREFLKNKAVTDTRKAAEALQAVHDLLPRHERQVNFFNWYMDHGGIEKELFDE